MNPKELPVYLQRAHIIQELKSNQVIVIESPTGSGKTTQLPLILNEAGYTQNGMVGVTQPRRIAAVSVCEYIAKQLGTEIPGFAGYKMRFDDQTSPMTRIKIMTDGILLQELKADPNLSEYSVMIVDEAHERSLNIDFILGLLKGVLQLRPDFKVIISSATINSGTFSEYFDGCPIIHIEAQIFPVDIRYISIKQQNSDESLVEEIVSITQRHSLEDSQGDILIFLPGEKLIKDCAQSLEDSGLSNRLQIMPLFGRLSKEIQERVFLPTEPGKKKVVIATNIAETSITIDGISIVIDSGLAKLNYYDQKTFTSSLIQSPVSRASCNQRKGRAGRTKPGICYRLYSKKDFEMREMYTPEEIKRTDLSEVVLRMAELGIFEFETFDFITSPGKAGIKSAIQTLRLLGALKNNGELTHIGELMTQFPMLPRHSRMIVESILHYPNVMLEVLIASAFLSSRTPFILPVGKEMEARQAHQRFSTKYGDFVSYLKIYRAFNALSDHSAKEAFCKHNYLDIQTMYEIINIVQQLGEIVANIGVPILEGGSVHDYLCSVSSGLIQFVCTKDGREVYRSLTAEKIYIHPGSSMFRESPEIIVAGEIVKTSRMFARSVSPILKEWLEDIYPGLKQDLLTPGKSRTKQVNTIQQKSGKINKTQDNGFSKHVIIGDTMYPIISEKGKKRLVAIPLEDIIQLYPTYSANKQSIVNHKAVIIFHDYVIHSGDKLSSIMKMVPYITPEKGILDKAPGGTFTSHDKLQNFCDLLDNILMFTKIKRKTKVLGFLTLFCSEQGDYWFKAVKSFHSAVDSSLYSLSVLVDELNTQRTSSISQHQPTPEEIKKVNEAFRRLSLIFENY